MKILIQPGDGIGALLKAIKKAKSSVEIVIFRFDRRDLERALVEAVERGVSVHALIAFTNRGGEKNLRKLESRLLAKGITVARTAGDLVRYHGKMMLIDRKELFVLGFNFTHMDIDRSRSFGLITRNSKLVQDAARLFEADSKRQEYAPGHNRFVVSPVNARKVLASFIKGAKSELRIYDPKISDAAFLRLLRERLRAGVKIRVIGEASGGVPSRRLKRMRLHTRTIICDRNQAFLGSQSLRQIELDARREIGVIFRDGRAIASLARIFDEDWAASEAVVDRKALPLGKAAKHVARAIVKKLPPHKVVKRVVKQVRRNGFEGKKVEEGVVTALEEVAKEAAKSATKEAVKLVAAGLVDDSEDGEGRA